MPSVVLALGRHEPERWRAGLHDELMVSIGRGRVPSALQLNGDPPTGAGTDAAFERLRSAARSISSAPVQVDARLGIGIFGPDAMAAAVARGIVIQLAEALSPADVIMSCSETSPLAALPHFASPATAPGIVEFRPADDRVRSRAAPAAADDSVLIAVSRTSHTLPRRCRVVIRVGDPCELVRHPDRDLLGPIHAEPVSSEQVFSFATLLAAAARQEGIGTRRGGLPSLVSFESLPVRIRASDDRRHLSCALGLGAEGPVTIDLVVDGPHAVVGGTTGSGKSELLVSWVLGMAAAYSPEAVNFLLVDFKGGSSFAAVRDLPHSVGLITDLDSSSAARALTSLGAELRYRERVLAGSGARAIDDLPEDVHLPRLVIVVDEFAAMVNDFPDLHQLFADIAARGRSLGVHLILCTQRPSGAIRDSVLANCTLRVCLRVNNAADSVAVLGTGGAAQLPRFPLGRGLFSIAGAEPLPVQVALADAADAERVGKRWTGATVRRPWCEPLPARILREHLPAASRPGIPFGLLDVPERQVQETAVFDPGRDGNLMVLGSHRAGKTGVLSALQCGAEGLTVRWLPAAVEDAWDAVATSVASIRAGRSAAQLLLIDDVDVLAGRFPEEYQHAFVDLVTVLVREGGAAGIHVVMTAQRLSGGLQSVAALCDSRLVLRLPNRQEHLLAGGGGDFDPALPPGGGVWQGHRMQIVAAVGAGPAQGRRPPMVAFGDHRSWVIVSAAPRQLAERLRQRPELPAEVVELAGVATSPSRPTVQEGEVGAITVADPDTWQAHWALFARLKSTAPVIFDGCGTAHFRALTGIRLLPPPIAQPSGAVWVLRPDGTVVRARL